MSVLKRKRKESSLEVFHHMVKLRAEVTDLLLRDFGYKKDKAEKRVQKVFGNQSYESLSEGDRRHYDKLKKRNKAFDEWFILDQRKAIIDCLRAIQTNLHVANSIQPIYMEELVERRIHQNKAVGYCYRLVQELQYAIETLPVDVNIYLRFGEKIQREIDLIKGWRKSDNRYKKIISEHSSKG